MEKGRKKKLVLYLCKDKLLDRDKSKILRVLRMFVFHEALHVHQGPTNYTVLNIGRFSRVLEEADYIADV